MIETALRLPAVNAILTSDQCGIGAAFKLYVCRVLAATFARITAT
jgi:hypothetical protein